MRIRGHLDPKLVDMYHQSPSMTRRYHQRFAAGEAGVPYAVFRRCIQQYGKQVASELLIRGKVRVPGFCEVKLRLVPNGMGSFVSVRARVRKSLRRMMKEAEDLGVLAYPER